MIAFTKMHGIGNDFVMVDGFAQDLSGYDLAGLAQSVCDRHKGIGGDGLIVAAPGATSPFAMRMWNPDGSESEMCGNGIRCFAQFLRARGLTDQDTVPVDTGAGRLVLDVLSGGRVRVDMGKARLTADEIGLAPGVPSPYQDVDLGFQSLRGTAVSMGNPHVVVFVPDVEAVPLTEWGPVLEHHAAFPRRVNVHFVQVLSRTHVRQRTWERGAGVTLACGTGACAVGVASFLNGHTERSCLVSLPGGDLEIEYEESGTVRMTGPAATVFEGTWEGA